MPVVRLHQGDLAPPEHLVAVADTKGAAQAAVIGKVTGIAGKAWIVHDGAKRAAAVEAPVQQGDVIETEAGGRIDLVLADRSTFSLKDKGNFTLDEFAYDPRAKTGKSLFTVVQGAFTFVSGEIAKTAPEASGIRTPVMTIGIRGTTVAGAVDESGATSVALLADPGSNFVGELVLSKPGGESFTVNTAGAGLVGATASSTWAVSANAAATVATFAPPAIAPPATAPALPPAPAATPGLAPGGETGKAGDAKGGETGEGKAAAGVEPPVDGTKGPGDGGAAIVGDVGPIGTIEPIPLPPPPPIDTNLPPIGGPLLGGGDGQGGSLGGEIGKTGPGGDGGGLFGPGEGSGGTEIISGGFNDPPPPPGPAYIAALASGSAVTGSISAVDPDGDPLTFNIGAVPAASLGTATMTGSTWTYLPGAVTGIDEFSIAISDGNGGSGLHLVHVDVVSSSTFTLPAGWSEIDLSGFSTAATVTGNLGADKIVGSVYGDTIDGGNGADTLVGGGGGDRFDLDHPAQATDTLTDFDIAEGDSLHCVYASPGAFYMLSPTRMRGLATGTGGVDFAGSSDNPTTANFNFTAWGGNGSFLSIVDNSASLTGSLYPDLLVFGGTTSGKTMTGGLMDDVLQDFSANGNSLFGGAGNDYLSAGDGDDYLDGGDGNNTVIGGAGSDTASYAASTTAITANLVAGTVSHDSTATDTVSGIERVVGSAYGDTFVTDGSAAVTAAGGAGNDTYSITGLPGADIVIDDSSGTDAIVFGFTDHGMDYAVRDYEMSGSDFIVTFEGGGTVTILADGIETYDDGSGQTMNLTAAGGQTAGQDIVIGSGAEATLSGGDGNDALVWASGTIVELDGGTGSGDAADFRKATTAVVADLSSGPPSATIAGNPAVTLTGIERLRGGSGDDVFTGDANDNQFMGGDGDNIITGGGGSDTVDYADQSAGVTVSLAAGTATHGTSSDQLFTIDNVIGSDFADTIAGDANANWISGNGGDDTIALGGGADTVVATKSGTAIVSDFSVGDGDAVELHNSEFSLGSSGTLTNGTDYFESTTAWTGSGQDYNGTNPSGAGVVAIFDGVSSTDLYYSSDLNNASSANSTHIAHLANVDTSALDAANIHLAV
ncbi:MAG: FecR domain-containing protein [Magnetospirillum sp.]|nr:FecR domain-containing protein [Magnetospirillum sp.]